MSPFDQAGAARPVQRRQDGRARRVSVISNDPTWTRRLAGGRETSEGIRCFDWSSTPLGPIGEWPPSLREAVSLCLRSRFQLAIY